MGSPGARSGASRRSRWIGAAVATAIVVAICAVLLAFAKATLDDVTTDAAEPGTHTSGAAGTGRAPTPELDARIDVAHGRGGDAGDETRLPKTPDGDASSGVVITIASSPVGPETPDDVAASANEDTGSAGAVSTRGTVAGPGDATTRSGSRARRAGDRADPDRVLDVRVVASETGKPLRDAVIDVTTTDGVPRRARADYRGLASFVVPAAGTVGIEAKSPGRLRRRIKAASVPVANQPYGIELVRGVVVKGTVTDARGPVRGATIRAFDRVALFASLPYGPDPQDIETTTSDARGSYRLDCIPRGVNCTLLVDAPDHATAQDYVEAQPDVDYSVRRDVRMAAAVPLVGEVRDHEDRPVAGAAVYALWPRIGEMFGETRFGRRDEDAEELGMLDFLGRARLGEAPLPWRAFTDEAGRFRIFVSESTTKSSLIAMHSVHGRSKPTVERAPRDGAGTLVLRGRVRAEFLLLDERGNAADGMSVTPYFPWERWSVGPRASGRYGVADMEEGPIAVNVSGPAGAPGTYVGRRVDADTLLWRCHLRDPATWRGVLTDDRGQHLKGARVSAGPVRTTTDEQGQFELAGVHPRETWIDATADGHIRESKKVDPKRTGRIVIQLVREATLRLQLVLPRDRAPPTWFRVWTLEGQYDDPVVIDDFAWDDGLVELPAVAKGWKYMVFVPGSFVLTGDVTAEPGAVEDRGKVELTAARSVVGDVVDEAGVPVGGASIGLVLVGNEPWKDAIPEREVETAADGSFALDLVSPTAACEYTVSAPGFATTPQRCPAGELGLNVVVIGRGRLFQGRWMTPNWRDVHVRLLGKNDETYARVRIRRDGGFDAEVPLRPHAVELLGGPAPDAKVVIRAEVPETFRDGDVFLIPDAPR